VEVWVGHVQKGGVISLESPGKGREGRACVSLEIPERWSLKGQVAEEGLRTATRIG
jgi:hypothetical protein